MTEDVRKPRRLAGVAASATMGIPWIIEMAAEATTPVRHYAYRSHPMTDTTAPTPAVSPLRELLELAGPTVAQMASYTLMQFIDVWILARAGFGVTAPTAAANAGMIAFSVISLGMGVEFVVNTMVSQSFGRGDHQSCGRYLWQGIWFGFAFSLLVLPLILFARGLFLRFGHEPGLAGLEGSYLRIVMMAAVLKLTATAVEQFLLGVDRPRVVAVASFIAVGVNTAVAWWLVYLRHGGVPASAVAQNIGVATELLIVSLMALQPSIRRQFGSTDFRFRPAVFVELLKLGIPSGIQIVAEVAAWSVFTVWVMAAFQTDAMAANIFVFKYMSVSFMPAFGMSVAVTALVGRYTGMNRPDIARARAHLGFAVTSVYMVFCGIILFTFRHDLMRLFTPDPDVIRIGSTLLVVAAIYQLFDALYIVYNGALRGVGDTLVPATATAVLCWTITVGLGRWIAVAHSNWGPVGPWFAALGYGVTIGVFITLRFTRRPMTDLAKTVGIPNPV